MKLLNEKKIKSIKQFFLKENAREIPVFIYIPGMYNFNFIDILYNFFNWLSSYLLYIIVLFFGRIPGSTEQEVLDNLDELDRLIIQSIIEELSKSGKKITREEFWMELMSINDQLTAEEIFILSEKVEEQLNREGLFIISEKTREQLNTEELIREETGVYESISITDIRKEDEIIQIQKVLQADDTLAETVLMSSTSNSIANEIDHVFPNISEYSLIDIIITLPEIYLIIMILCGFIIIGTVNFYPKSNNNEKKLKIMPIIYSFSINVLYSTIILCLHQMLLVGNSTVLTFVNYAINDFYTTTFKIVVILTIILILKVTQKGFKFHPRHLIEYPLLILLVTLFLLILISAYNLIALFLAIIGFSLVLYVLLLNDSFNKSAREAGIKYFYLSTISTGLLIGGIFLAYLLFNTISFMSIAWILHNWTQNGILENTKFLLTVMLYFIIFGILFKLAAFPCHLWAAEIYDGSPNTIFVLFILPIKIATFIILIRLLGHTFSDLYQYWYYILWFSSCFSMIWGCLGALIEKKIKRFLAYSSINQMGFLLMGLTTGTMEGYKSSLLYLLIYILMNAGFFLLYLKTKDIKTNRSLIYLTDLNIFAQKNFLYSFGIVIILLSMAGIPPLAGFFGKYYLFLHCIETGNIFLVIIGMITSVIASYYYVKLIKIMWFEKPLKTKLMFETVLTNIEFKTYFAIIYILIIFLLVLPAINNYLNYMTIKAIHPLIW